MKKLAMVSVLLLMIVSLSVTVLAAPNGFIPSVSGRPDPSLDDFVSSNPTGTEQIIVTPFDEIEELPEELQELFEEAYEAIVNSEQITDLNTALAEVAQAKGVAFDDLAVSDLVDIRLVGGTNTGNNKVEYTITLNAESLKNFVGLLHMESSNNWELVEDAEVIEDGTKLRFSVDSFSPFAIVVDGSKEVPKTGDNSKIYVYGALMAASALAFVVVWVKARKLSV